MKYRILIVDDSIVMRRVVRQALESDAEIEIVGVAANGNRSRHGGTAYSRCNHARY